MNWMLAEAILIQLISEKIDSVKLHQKYINKTCLQEAVFVVT